MNQSEPKGANRCSNSIDSRHLVQAKNANSSDQGFCRNRSYADSPSHFCSRHLVKPEKFAKPVDDRVVLVD
jgi:hypothetical protein